MTKAKKSVDALYQNDCIVTVMVIKKIKKRTRKYKVITNTVLVCTLSHIFLNRYVDLFHFSYSFTI